MSHDTYIFHASKTTTNASVNTISIAGLTKIRISALGAPAYYIILPSSSTSTIATVSAVSEKQTDLVWDFSVSTNAPFQAGMPVSFLDASDTDTLIMRGIVLGSSRNGTSARAQDADGTQHIGVISSVDTTAAFASTDKIVWTQPSTTGPIGTLINPEDDHVVNVPDWAQSTGVIKFLRVASTDTTLTVSLALSC